MNKQKKYFAVSWVNFRYTTWIAYLAAGICVIAMIVDLFVDTVMGSKDIFTISPYSMLYIIPLIAPVLIATVNYGKLMNIGVKKKTFFSACALNYVIFALIISIVGTLAYYFVDIPLNKIGYNFYGIIDIFGWNTSIFDTFFSQLTFILLIQATVHTLAFMQTKWYGWAADILIAAVVSVFTPIPVLRGAEMFFFEKTMFARPAIIHILICLIMAVLFYLTNLLYLRHREGN